MKKLLLFVCAVFAVLAIASCSMEPESQDVPQVPDEPYVPGPGPGIPDPKLDELHHDKIYNKTKDRDYSTLEEAVSDMSSGDEIVFCKDVKTSSMIVVSKSCTIDLNGHILSRSSFSVSNEGIINVQGTANSHVTDITIKNGTVTGAAYGNLSSGLLRFVHVDNVVLENVNVKAACNKSSSTGSNSIYFAYGNLSIDNSTRNHVTGRIIAYNNASVSGAKPTCVSINGGFFSNDITSADPSVLYASNDNGPVSFIVNGGDFTGVFTSKNSARRLSDLSVRKAVWNQDVTQWVASSSVISKDDGFWRVDLK